MNIFCADIGSVSNGNFGWFGRHSDQTTSQGTDMNELVVAIADRMNDKGSVALGFEAPMFVPFRSDPNLLTKHREGETNPNWIGGPGAAVLATALVQVPWILRELKSKLSVQGVATTNWNEFSKSGANLFLWEAFVSGEAKGKNHVEDAQIAVERFEASLPDPTRVNAIEEPSVISLLGVALLRTSWSSDIDMLSRACMVVKA